ncbi:uncharacterized protein LOC115740187 [Rhodamnia argentea]|uniref:Uncharacterized protein LOC115740187 n=1 Tax=Rhodamnia argentea TaxID=178133 RepID=A0A8B8P3T5_9MYRT|nr:uncharacterized protein LOC115740187 [Rhodamnia argentea]
MHNSDPHSKNHHHHHLVSPRISFSNDFAESQYTAKQERQAPAPAAAASSDFEFSVSSNSMMSADELFCKGKLLPFKEKATAKSSTTTTLREELLAGEEGSGGAGSSFRPPKGSGRWRGFLGLRKSHIGSKKADKSCEASCDSKRTAGFGPVPDNMHYHGKTSQEMMRQGGSNSCRDEEMEM